MNDLQRTSVGKIKGKIANFKKVFFKLLLYESGSFIYDLK